MNVVPVSKTNSAVVEWNITFYSCLSFPHQYDNAERPCCCTLLVEQHNVFLLAGIKISPF